MLKVARVLACAVLLLICTSANAQSILELVEQAVGTELAADAADHTHWLYYEQDQTPGSDVSQWVAQTDIGDLKRVLELNGVMLTRGDQQSRMNSFINSPSAQQKERKAGQQDDRQATQMLHLLPQAFLWTKTSDRDGNTTLHFKPNPSFSPPTWASRVFAAMEGDMTVNDEQHRIVSLKGHMIHDVKFWGGLLGSIKAGGTFNVERREIGKGVWQITATHVHIEGRALLFKSISDQEDDDKTRFKQLPGDISPRDAEKLLLAQAS